MNIEQNYLVTCGWDLLWALIHNHATHLEIFNKKLDAYIATLSILSNEDLGVLYFRTLDIQKNIKLSKVTTYPNILINRHIEFLT